MLVLVSLTFFISWAPLNIFNIILDLTNAFKVPFVQFVQLTQSSVYNYSLLGIP
jgi:hypothetical protein